MARRGGRSAAFGGNFAGGGVRRYVPTEILYPEPEEVVPEWPPAGYDVWIDLVPSDEYPEGRAYVEGVGDVDVDTLLGTDAGTVNGMGPSSFNPAKVLPEGYFPGASFIVAFLGAAKTKALAGATTVIVSAHALDFSVMNTAGSHAVYSGTSVSSNRVSIETYAGTTASTLTAGVTAPGPNKFATTLTPTRAEGAVNGSAAAVAVIDSDDWPGGGMNAACIGGNALTKIRQIGVRSALATVGELPALSQT